MVASVRAKLADGRSMSALKEAKDLAKRQPGPAADALLADAYAARIADLSRSGMLREAAEVVAVAQARFPDRAELWATASLDVAHASGDLSVLLGRWRDEPDQRDALGAELRRTVRDPAWIADCAALPADDPLRTAAAGVAAAFAQAAAGALDDAGREALRAVGRRSPLVAWRAFVLALDAFHGHDDARCLQQLAAIAGDDAVAPGRDVLLAALFERPLPPSGAQRRAVERLVGTAPAAVVAARPLDDREVSNREFFAALEATFVALKPLGRRPLLRFLRWVAEHCDPESAVHCADRAGAGPRALGDDWWRMLALVSHEPFECLFAWVMWLVPKPATCRKLADRELALTLEQVVGGVPVFVVLAAQKLGLHMVQRWECGRSVERELDEYHERCVSDDDLEFLTLWLAWSTLFDHLERRTGIARDGLPTHVQLLRHVAALDPTSARFARVCEALDGPDRKLRDAECERWSAALPDDVEPWLLRAREAEARGALKLALGHVERAEALAPVDARVRAARMRLLIAALQRHWRNGKPHLCEKDLAALEALPSARSPDARAFLLGVRVHLGGPAGAAAEGELQGLLGSAHRVRSLGSLVAQLLGRDGEVRVEASTAAEWLADVAFVARVATAVGEELVRLPAGSVDLRSVTPADLPAGAEELLDLCDLCAQSGERHLRALAAGAGLRAGGPRLARFLLHRAACLPPSAVERALLCLRLAQYHAARLGDAVAHRALSSKLPPRFLELTDDEAREALAAERDAADQPAARPRTAKARRRSHPTLPFDDEPPQRTAETTP